MHAFATANLNTLKQLKKFHLNYLKIIILIWILN